jgi:hypothetical protein
MPTARSFHFRKLEQSSRQEHAEVEKLRQQTAQLSAELAAKSAALERERHLLSEQHAKLGEQVETLRREKMLSEERAKKEHQLLNQVSVESEGRNRRFLISFHGAGHCRQDPSGV